VEEKALETGELSNDLKSWVEWSKQKADWYDPVLWSLSDNREFDEIMSIRLWNEVNKEEELLEFDY
jgi:hypothetical protein